MTMLYTKVNRKCNNSCEKRIGYVLPNKRFGTTTNIAYVKFGEA